MKQDKLRISLCIIIVVRCVRTRTSIHWECSACVCVRDRCISKWSKWIHVLHSCARMAHKFKLYTYFAKSHNAHVLDKDVITKDEALRSIII